MSGKITGRVLGGSDVADIDGWSPLGAGARPHYVVTVVSATGLAVFGRRRELFIVVPHPDVRAAIPAATGRRGEAWCR